MTIQEAISRGRLPNIDPKKLISVCSKLGIPARDLSYALTDEQLRRLNMNLLFIDQLLLLKLKVRIIH